jgi:hypothetical protein
MKKTPTIIATSCIVAVAFSLASCAGGAALRGIAGPALSGGARMGAVRIGALAAVPEAVATEAASMRIGALGAGRVVGTAEASAGARVVARATSGDVVGSLEFDGARSVVVRDSAGNLITRTSRIGSRYVHFDAAGTEIGYSTWSASDVTCLNHYRLVQGREVFIGRDMNTATGIYHYDAAGTYTGRTPLESARTAIGRDGSIILDVAALAAAAGVSRQN